MIAPVQLDAVLAVSKRTLEQLKTINRLWLDAVKEANSSAADLSARLVKCGNAAEGAALWMDWVRERTTRAASVGQEATKLWAGLYGAAFAGSNETASLRGDGEERDGARKKHPSAKAA